MHRIVASLVTFLILTTSAVAGTVTYYGQGYASGLCIPLRGTGDNFFSSQPTTVSLSYDYDPTLVPVVQGGLTTFTVSTLKITADIPGFLRIAPQQATAPLLSTVVWSGDTLTCESVEGSLGRTVPFADVAVVFPDTALPPGLLPSSLDSLLGVPGYFAAKQEGGIGYGGPSGQASGSVMSVPEPVPALLLLVGVVLAGIASRLWGA